jgi:hypothetical protein
MAGRDKFRDDLVTLGYEIELREQDKLIIPFQISEGRFANQQIKIGIQVPGDFEMTPPGGIHLSPQLIPINTAPQDHTRAAESPFGQEWIYLSRPFAEQWPLKRTTKRYMEWVAHLINTL